MSDTNDDSKSPPEPELTEGAAAFKNGKKPGPQDAPVQVRDAGGEAMANKPKDWEEHDQAVDESFPASDPPGTY